MTDKLNLDILPSYCYSAFKIFAEGEKHVIRYCEEDVLIIMLSGTLYFTEDKIPVTLTKGQYYIQKHGLFQEGVIPSSDARYYFVHFHGNFTECINSLPLRGEAYFSEAFEGFERLDFLQVIKASAVEKNAEFYRILSKLKTEGDSGQNKKIVLQIITLITENLQKSYSLEDLSSYCGYSKNYLIRVFKQETGQTPFTYITGLRLHHAKTLLTDSDLLIGEIGERCGFGSYINFYKAFAGQFGEAPETWRRRMRGLKN